MLAATRLNFNFLIAIVDVLDALYSRFGNSRSKCLEKQPGSSEMFGGIKIILNFDIYNIALYQMPR